MSRSLMCLCLWIVTSACYATESIEAFSKTLLTALETRDAQIFESLIFPGSLKIDLEKNRKKISLVLKQQPPSSYTDYQVSVIDINENKDYDATTNSVFLFGSKRAEFPIKLEKQLTIYVSEGDESQDGKWTTPLMTQVLSQHQGHWYMVWPTAIK